MFNQKFVACVKSNGKILREHGEKVFLPLSCEYSILLKNLNVVRALVNVYIDGANATPGGLVVMPGQEVDLERWIKDGNLLSGNRFKFIERTAAIEEYRGIKTEDGIVRVEFSFERIVEIPKSWHSTPFYSNPVFRSANTQSWVGSCSSSVTGSSNSRPLSAEVNTVSATYCAGITVPGSESNQKFQTAAWFMTEDAVHSIVFQLVGGSETVKVESPVTVKTKIKCPTCGKKNKTTQKFCSDCGTAVHIL